MNKTINRTSAFTIVELLVVIVVIGILAAITIVSYSGITARANAVSVQVDAASASKKMKMYYTVYGVYPTSMSNDGNGNYCPTAPTPDTEYCLRPSGGNSFSYNFDADPDVAFVINVSKGQIAYVVTKDGAPT